MGLNSDQTVIELAEHWAVFDTAFVLRTLQSVGSGFKNFKLVDYDSTIE